MGRKSKLDFLTYEMLVQLNWVEEKSLNKIAAEHGVFATSIFQYAKKIGFIAKNGNKIKSKLKNLTYEELYNLHCVEDKSLNYIAEMYFVGTPAIRALAKKLKVPIKQIAIKKLKDLTYNIFYQMYWIEEKSMSEIAKIYKVTIGGIRRRAIKLNIELRDKKTATSLAVSGDKNSMRNLNILEKRSGENHHFFNKSRSDDTKEKISKTLTKHFEENGSHNLGREHLHLRGKKRDPEIVARVKLTNKLKRDERLKNEPDNPEGISINERARKLSEYSEWRRRCYIRDGNCCQICKTKKAEFHVDHIIPFSFLLKENNITTLKEAVDCKNLWNIENGRVLCLECHEGTDTYKHKARKYVPKIPE